MKIGWANYPKINHAKINDDSTTADESSSINSAFEKLDIAYKCITKSSWTCPDPGCRHVNDLQQDRCVKCKFSRDFPVAKSKHMVGKGSPATYKGRDGKPNVGSKTEHHHLGIPHLGLVLLDGVLSLSVSSNRVLQSQTE